MYLYIILIIPAPFKLMAFYVVNLQFFNRRDVTSFIIKFKFIANNNNDLKSRRVRSRRHKRVRSEYRYILTTIISLQKMKIFHLSGSYTCAECDRAIFNDNAQVK
uniref:Uncharacterized protein n=1 Tax=Cacopsylla melanoneura TaxID=428564 RepID=A0A8D8ZD58_9HEMI